MVVACYPDPPIPDIYNPTYSPEFMVIFLKQEKLYQTKDKIEKIVQDEVNDLIILSAVCGSVRLLLTLFIIFQRHIFLQHLSN